MKRITKLSTLFTLVLFTLLGAANIKVSAQFNEKGKHWYYSDDMSFKYWGLTEVNDYGIPVDKETMDNISFDGATPANKFKIGQEDYSINAYVYQVPVTVNVKIGLRGDIVSNGTVDLYDAICIARYLINDYKFDSEFHEFIADYNIDGRVDLYDAIDISKMILQQSISGQIADKQQKEEFINKVLQLVNQERASVGLNPLTLDTSLCNAAQKRAIEISTGNDIQHTRPDGREFYTILEDFNISYKYAGENIAGGYMTPEAVVMGWMDSEGHRENILDPYFTKIGLGFYKKENTKYQYYWSQLFIQN